MTENTTVLHEVKGRVALLTINRPEALNALNIAVQQRMVELLKQYDKNADIGCIVITGSPKAFARRSRYQGDGAHDRQRMAEHDFFAGWREVATIRTPIVAAVSGYALGAAACELAMACDLVVAGEIRQVRSARDQTRDHAGMGGSQRLTKLVGRSKAMELILTGRNFTAAEAESMGLVARSSRRRAARQGARARRDHRQLWQARRPRRQGGRESRRRTQPERRPAVRTEALPRPVRHPRPEGRDGRLQRKTTGEIHQQITA